MIISGDISYLILPFFLVLAIVYGALDVGGVFKNKKINFLIATIFGFFSITSDVIVEFIYTILPYATIFFIVVFFLGFLKNAISFGKRDYTLLMVCIGLLLLFLSTFEGIEIGEDIISLIVLVFIVLVFIAAFFMKSE